MDFPFDSVFAQLCLFYDMVIALVFFLVQAARRIAPPSENHSLVSRLLALAPLLPMPLLMLFQNAGAGEEMRNTMQLQALLALVGFMLVCVLELATTELPMAVHVRRLFGRGGDLRGLRCLLFLPGWASAAIFTLAGLGLLSVLVFAGAFPDPLAGFKFARVLGLVWVAVVFPAALMSLFVKRGGFMPVIVYGGMQVAAGLLCIAGAFIINNTGSAIGAKGLLEDVFRVLPVTGFWFELGFLGSKRHAIVDVPLLGAQIMVCAISTCFIAWRAMPFFRAFKAGVRSIKPVEPGEVSQK